ncbi:MAG: tetraacyldisaccharide 4'-kinase [Microscillaceae bacterium]
MYPFTLFYTLATGIRNHLYDRGFWKSFSFDLPVISVGNLTVGGTGKTPHIEYLIRFLQTQYALSTLSRGYGRKSRGFRLATSHDNAQSLGDEPFQLYQKFGSQIGVAVGEDRVAAIPHLLHQRPQTQIILLDDAFQHRPVAPQLTILLTDYGRLFYQDFPFPSGRLRESRRGARRADIIIVSKCPVALSEAEKTRIQEKIGAYARKDVPVFFTTIAYESPRAAAFSVQQTPLRPQDPVFFFAGLAQNHLPEMHLRQHFLWQGSQHFADHYPYHPRDLEKMVQRVKKNSAPGTAFITTEKDYAKLQAPLLKNCFQEVPLFILPIQVQFLDKEVDFQERVRNCLVFSEE